MSRRGNYYPIFYYPEKDGWFRDISLRDPNA